MIIQFTVPFPTPPQPFQLLPVLPTYGQLTSLETPSVSTGPAGFRRARLTALLYGKGQRLFVLGKPVRQ